MNALDRAASATVKITRKGGQGVVIPGGLILTAAHCITWDIEGSMVLGDLYLEDVEVPHATIRASPAMIDPICDIAVLEAPDSQACIDVGGMAADEAYGEFLAAVEPVPICEREFGVFEPFPVFIRSHRGKWITAKAELCAPGAHWLSITADEQVEGGTSGGPIVTENGELVGIVSNFSDVTGKPDLSTGMVPRPHLTLPVRVLNMIGGRLGSNG